MNNNYHFGYITILTLRPAPKEDIKGIHKVVACWV